MSQYCRTCIFSPQSTRNEHGDTRCLCISTNNFLRGHWLHGNNQLSNWHHEEITERRLDGAGKIPQPGIRLKCQNYLGYLRNSGSSCAMTGTLSRGKDICYRDNAWCIKPAGIKRQPHLLCRRNGATKVSMTELRRVEFVIEDKILSRRRAAMMLALVKLIGRTARQTYLVDHQSSGNR